MRVTDNAPIRMLDPTVASPVTELAAPDKLLPLDGKRVGLFTNGKLNATEVLEAAAEIILERFSPSSFDLFEDNIGFGRTQNDEMTWEEPPDVALVAIGD